MHRVFQVCAYTCLSAAPSSERAISLWHLQATSLTVGSRQKYLSSIIAFYDYCVLHHLPWSTASLIEWLPAYAIKDSTKILTKATMEQKCSQINFLTDLHPPMIAGGAIHPKRLLQAIGKLAPKVLTNKVLPVQFLLELSIKKTPSLMEVSVQLQTFLGLRGGHFCLLKPCVPFWGQASYFHPSSSRRSQC